MALRKLSPNDILPLIADYLEKAGLPDIAEQLTEYYDVEQPHPLKKYSLVKVIKFYVNNKKKLQKHFVEVQEEQDEEKEASEVEEQEEVPQKKEKSKKNKNIIQQEAPKPVKQIEKKPIASEPQQEEIQDEEPNKKRFFQKCDDNLIHTIRAELRDNTFEAKAKFGRGDAFGELGNEKLKFTKGDMFKKEKGKLKNRQFQGNGQIDMYAINSIKL